MILLFSFQLLPPCNAMEEEKIRTTLKKIKPCQDPGLKDYCRIANSDNKFLCLKHDRDIISDLNEKLINIQEEKEKEKKIKEIPPSSIEKEKEEVIREDNTISENEDIKLAIQENAKEFSIPLNSKKEEKENK